MTFFTLYGLGPLASSHLKQTSEIKNALKNVGFRLKELGPLKVSTV
jgi:hypothetical protein